MKNRGQAVSPRRVMRGSTKRQIAFFTMVIPGLILLICFSYLPMPGVIMAFKNYRLAVPPKDFWLQNKFLYSLLIKSGWVSLKNFEYLFNDFGMIVRNTIGYNILFMLVGLIMQVGLAVIINELRNRRTAKLYHTIVFMPYFVSWIVVMYALYAMICGNGLINQIIQKLGNEPISFYAEKKYWPFIFLLANVWKYTGQGSIIYLATITGFDEQLYEAAAIDGAGKWKQFCYITFPQLLPVIVMLQILAVGRIFNGDFDMFYSLPNGAGTLRNVTYTIDVYVYMTIKNSNVPNAYGLAGAAAFFQSVVGFVLILTTNLFVRRVQPEMALF